MPFADSNRGQLAFQRESAFNTVPAPFNPTLMRITTADFAADKSTEVSNEIRSDRMVPDLIETMFTSGGSANFELSAAGSFDDLLESALCGTYSNAGSLSGTDIAATGTGFDTGLNDPTAVFAVGQFVYINGFANAAINGWYRIASMTSASITTETAPPAAEAASAAVTIVGKTLSNGVVARSYALELGFADVNEYILFLGQRLGTMSLEVQAGQIVTGTFGFQGAAVQQKTGPFSNTLTQPPTGAVLNATSNVGKIRTATGVEATGIQSVTLNLDNSLRNQNAVGNKFPEGIGYGRQLISGSLTAYFQNGQLYQKFLNHEAASLEFGFNDILGNAIHIYLPKVYFGSDNPNLQGIDQDVMENIEFTAVLDGATAKQIQVDIATQP